MTRWIVKNERHSSALSFPELAAPAWIGGDASQLGVIVVRASAHTSASVDFPRTTFFRVLEANIGLRLGPNFQPRRSAFTSR